MKALYSFFIAIMVAAFLIGCGNKPVTDPNAPNKPAELADLKQAVQTFNTQEGHWPKTLNELTPKYLPKIPDAPNGFRIIYDSVTGEVRIGR